MSGEAIPAEKNPIPLTALGKCPLHYPNPQPLPLIEIGEGEHLSFREKDKANVKTQCFASPPVIASPPAIASIPCYGLHLPTRRHLGLPAHLTYGLYPNNGIAARIPRASRFPLNKGESPKDKEDSSKYRQNLLAKARIKNRRQHPRHK